MSTVAGLEIDCTENSGKIGTMLHCSILARSQMPHSPNWHRKNRVMTPNGRIDDFVVQAASTNRCVVCRGGRAVAAKLLLAIFLPIEVAASLANQGLRGIGVRSCQLPLAPQPPKPTWTSARASCHIAKSAAPQSTGVRGQVLPVAYFSRCWASGSRQLRRPSFLPRSHPRCPASTILSWIAGRPGGGLQRSKCAAHPKLPRRPE